MSEISIGVTTENFQDSDNGEKAKALRKMKIAATSLFCVMAVIFIIAHIYEKSHYSLSFIKAFSEAGMVGALADWFAVVALFKKPLGFFPYHTDIIASNKDKIGKSLADFVKDHFLTKEVLIEKFTERDIAGTASNWLSNKENTRRISKIVAEWTPKILKELDDADIKHLIRNNLINEFREIDFSKLAGDTLDILTSDNKHLELLDKIITDINSYISINKENIYKSIEHKKPWFMEFVPDSINSWIVNLVLDKINEILKEIKMNKKHNIRAEFGVIVNKIVNDLKTSDKFKKNEIEIKEKIINSKLIQDYLDNIWVEIKKRIIKDLGSNNSTIKETIENTLGNIGYSISNDHKAKEKINKWLTDFLADLISRHSGKLTSHISEQIEKWDGEKMSKEIELAVGKDLQYIRINGTLVGGTVGLVIFIVSQFM